MASGAAGRAARRLVFFGPPGSGKGSYASKIAPILKIPTISTGDLIRAEIKAKSKLGLAVQVRVPAPELVSDDP